MTSANERARRYAVPIEERRYAGPIEDRAVFTAPGNDGKLGFRRVMVVGRYDDETLILEELPSRFRGVPVGGLFKCPELNLRAIFQPEDPR